ncbi:hypothetical protein BT96DRAFT_1105323 [Gymnopus androsaceus JB14]|uniref:Uncharacterized protein n=1 Tax=Gymnopus androsaceus JB14 TaxID=1447944 RepID=A0A6A4GDX6_9AGAR|nr:hypothetical protein BT96DRAFT_1105323 [Gymnopus androsaceus JB14]
MDSSRKPSGSSPRSGTHSPIPSPMFVPTRYSVLNSRLTVGPSAISLQPTDYPNDLWKYAWCYNSGWELWGPGSPSQRNPASASDIPSSQTDPGYRGTIRESWTSSS